MKIGEINRTIETDVLVVGGSGAGVTAAIGAKRSGAKVLLVSKGKVGYSGNAIMAGGGFSVDGESAYHVCGKENADPSFTKDILFENIVKESYFMSDQNMVEQYVEESPEIVHELLQWGEKAGQSFLFSPPSTWISAGISWTKALKQGLKENPEIEVLEDVMVVELLVKDGQANGAIGIDIYTGEIIQFEAKAVVLGTGGFQPCTLKNTVTDMTGDGIGMAYRAGVKLADMEFLLAFATALYPNEMKGSIYPFVMEFNMRDVKYDVRDAKGEAIDIPEEIIKLSRGKKLSKLVSMYYWGKAIQEGRGTKNDGVYLDYRDNDKDILIQSLENFFERFSAWHKHGYYKGEDMSIVKEKMLKDGLIEVGLGYEYSMGGILVDEKMKTDVLGLYAAGEVTSGVFGANRVRDGLTEMLCQGYRAGLSAAEFAQDTQGLGIDISYRDTVLERITRPFKAEKGISSIHVHQDIEKVCDEGFGMIRNEAGLLKALKELERIREEGLPNIYFKEKSPSYNYEWIDYLQVENLLICAEAAIKAALMRKESRGCHIRSDYPEINHDHYMYRIISKNNNGKMELETRKPIVTKIPLPTGKKENVIEYFLDKDLQYKG
ncbi:FAD-binding protein [Irregularibacter muris]|uniref:FAD-binding protein n=1 Tax=Irregularibacter muris TaxID=1796619 RepID=A0AAE3L320_9FIRM|nr:FAD-binding protein [Irregularibacter muris]MCR1899744.1 FAD-binding protein [Irregularibacter muris]